MLKALASLAKDTNLISNTHMMIYIIILSIMPVLVYLKTSSDPYRDQICT